MNQVNMNMPNIQLPTGIQVENTGKPQPPPGPIVIYPDQRFRKMTQDETTNLKNNIERLTIEQKRGIVEIVQRCLKENNNGDARIEFELDKLPADTARELERYVTEQVA